jgi:hypothetical protein
MPGIAYDVFPYSESTKRQLRILYTAGYSYVSYNDSIIYDKRRQQLATRYSYFTSFGLTYTFGSIYNNVVNPRFGNNGGGGMSFSMSY